MYLGTPTTARDGSRLPVTRDGPQAHLAIQGAATDPLPPHFHGVEQFQLFVSGAGTVGRHAVSAGVVHYTDRHTVYGPLRPGPAGMAYATLRAWHDPGASFMPGSRAELAEALASSGNAPASRRNLALPLDAGRPGTWSDVVAEDDGLRVAVASVEPGATSAAVVGGGGAYLAVLDGEIVASPPAGPGSITWVERGRPVTVVAAGRGATLALLQFPWREAPPRADQRLASERASNTSR
jgi:hypothetical protein